MKLDRLILTVLLFTTTCLSAETIVANSEQIVFNSHKQLYTTKTPIQTGIARRSEPINLPGYIIYLTQYHLTLQVQQS